MSDTQVDRDLCAAPYCPMLASMSKGTNDPDKKWLCFCHFSAKQNDWHGVSAELNRLGWLVEIVRTLRAGAKLTDDQHRQFGLAQRGDLLRKESEWPREWMVRLEGVLQQSCKDSAVQP